MFLSHLASRRLGLAALAIALGGCSTLAPDYERPPLPVPASLDGASPDTTAVTYVPAAWRAVFVDQQLREVMELALANNRDLRVALLNIEKARAQYRIQRADSWPSVNLNGQHSASRSVIGEDATQVNRSSSLQAGLSSWELDLFGRLRSLNQQALETYLETEQTQRSTQLSLLSETASAWLEIAASQQRLAVARDTLASQQRTLALTRAMHDEGIVSGVDLASVQASVESARVDVSAYETDLAQARNALDLLAGTAVPDRLLPDAGLDAMQASVILSELPAGLPSSVLLLRPDVQAAEHALLAANANIGAARAAFFPSISLTAGAGIGSQSLSDLFDGGGHRIWSFAPSITLPIFNAGALRAELDVATLSRDINVAQYERAIQTAFRETADALAVRARIAERLDAQQALVAATQRSYDLADARYRNGVDSYLETLTAQRSLYAARQSLISLRLEEAINRITLFKVLGGDASNEAAPVAASAGTASALAP